MWISDILCTSGSLELPFSHILNRNACTGYPLPVPPLCVSCSLISSVSQIKRKCCRRAVLKNYTWGYSSIPGPDLKDEIMDFELMLHWVRFWVALGGTECVLHAEEMWIPGCQRADGGNQNLKTNTRPASELATSHLYLLVFNPLYNLLCGDWI